MIPVHAPMDEALLQTVGVLELAHVGDGVYELLVRTYLARQGGAKIGELHRRTVSYVAAPAQAAAMERLMPHLSQEEEKVWHRGRNAHVHSAPSGCTLAQYHAATGLEALFGHLWLTGQVRRIQELFAIIEEGEDHAS